MATKKKVFVENNKDNEQVDDVEDINETEAADTLKPHSETQYRSRTEMMGAVMQAMSGMSQTDMIDFFNKTAAVVKPENPVPDGAAQSNAKTIQAKTVREDVEQLLGTDETISEEFKQKASTLFEAAVNARVASEIARLEEQNEAAMVTIEEQLEQTIDEALEAIVEQYGEKIDDYLTYVAEQWMEENAVAVENGLKAEMFDNFIGKMKDLFVEHYIDVPESEIDAVNELSSALEETESKLNASITNEIKLAEQNEMLQREIVFNHVASDLSVMKAEKLRGLVEDIEADDLEQYRSKIETIKETYFRDNGSDVDDDDDKDLNEDHNYDVVQLDESEDNASHERSNDPNINRYVENLSRLSRGVAKR